MKFGIEIFSFHVKDAVYSKQIVCNYLFSVFTNTNVITPAESVYEPGNQRLHLSHWQTDAEHWCSAVKWQQG